MYGAVKKRIQASLHAWERMIPLTWQNGWNVVAYAILEKQD